MKQFKNIINDPGTLQEILDNINAYIYIKDAQGRYLYVNKHVLKLFDCGLDDIMGRDDSALFSLDESDDLSSNDAAVLREGRTIEGEERNIIRETGETRHYWVIKHPMRDDEGRITGMYGISIDITETNRLKEELEKMANTDRLTQLANRRHFMEMAEKTIAQAGRYGTPCSIISFDMDHFKDINDQYGHHAGDEVLRKVAETCRSLVRDADMPGRLGGEEFSILLPQTDLKGARELAERLRRSIADLKLEGSWVGIIDPAISAGVAALEAGEDIDNLLLRADKKLYEAKNAGRNRVFG